MKKSDKIAAVILAAGRGVRMRSKNINKVMLPLNGRPMISYTIDLLKKLRIKEIIIVVGFAQKSVRSFLGPNYLYVEQKKRLGTAHAVRCALKKIPQVFKEIVVLDGDDSAFYRPQMIKDLIGRHREKQAVFTMLTIETKNPCGLGRILRDRKGRLLGIVEEKDARPDQRKIKEVNPACYIFERKFLEKYLPKVRKSPFSGEYYLTDVVKLGIDSQEKTESLKVKNLAWRGINTWEELKEAEKLMEKMNYAN